MVSPSIDYRICRERGYQIWELRGGFSQTSKEVLHGLSSGCQGSADPPAIGAYCEWFGKLFFIIENPPAQIHYI